MRDISELPESFDQCIEKLKLKIKTAQDHSTDEMYMDAIERIEIPTEARNITQFIQYQNSLEKSETVFDEHEFKSKVYSDLLVGGDNPKWENVPVGAFLEWGTGPLGESTNNYPHGYDYTTDAPWDEHTAIQWGQLGTWGITARPHLYPALVAIKGIHIENIKEAIEESWMKSEN